MPATPEEIAAAEAAADAKLAAVHEPIDREREAAGARFGGSIVHGDQHGVSGGTHYGDIHVGTDRLVTARPHLHPSAVRKGPS